MSDTSKPFGFLQTNAPTAARRLLGCELVRQINGQTLRVRIVETEAYDQTDPASHSFRGITNRTRVMFGPAGHLYVYFTYGMHYCCNVVVGETGHGAAVLIRAAEPLKGIPTMAELRPSLPASANSLTNFNLTNGPAKLCQALAITTAMNGHYLTETPLQLIQRPSLTDSAITQTTRIGIKQATEQPWRFYVTDSPWVSRQ